MTPTNVELYEALKPTVGEEAARMIAEVVPPTRDLATKSDVEVVRHDLSREIDGVRREVHDLRTEVREGFAKVDGRFHAESARTIKWMLGFFIPVWAGTWATVVAVLLKT